MLYDINLVPKSKRKESSRIGFHMFMIGIACAVVLLVCFLLLPLQFKLAMKAKLQEQQSELASYSEVEAEYSKATEDVNRLSNIVSILEQLRTSKKETSALLNEIEKCMPKFTTLTSITAENGLVTINGTSETYKAVAQFMVNLRMLEDITAVTFTTATVQEDIQNTGVMADKLYDFTIFIKYDYKDVISEAQLQTTAAEEEGTGNETN